MAQPFSSFKIGSDRRPLLADLLEQTFVIKGYKLEDSKFGQAALISVLTPSGNVVEYWTTSQVVISQLEQLPKESLAKGVMATLRRPKGKRYLTLE